MADFSYDGIVSILASAIAGLAALYSATVTAVIHRSSAGPGGIRQTAARPGRRPRPVFLCAATTTVVKRRLLMMIFICAV